MFDLPFNPDLLEQRIGRLDRIGQAHDIQIHVPYLEKTAQSVLVRWYHEGLDAFEHTCPTGRTVYDSVHDELINYLAAPESIDGFDDLIKSCRQQHDALKAQLEQGRDRLLEIHSNGGEKAQALAESIEEQDDDTSLIAFSMNLFDIVGINQDDRGENLIVLTLPTICWCRISRACRKTVAPSPSNVTWRCRVKMRNLLPGNTR